ncbi:MAG: alpha/beta fold hydrolase [Polyangiaceae bacterium]
MNRWFNLLRRVSAPPPAVGQTPHDVIHHENKWRLLRYRPRAEGPSAKTPILLVPSLINRHYVLDLMPGKSFAEWLVAQGFDTYIIDWGTPGAEDRYLTFDDVCDGYLARALSVTTRTAKAEQAHVLGYCMGGTLAAIHAAARPERVATLTALAAPIGFHDDGLLSAWTRSKGFDVSAMVQGFGNVPWQLMQGAFHLLRPTLNLSKAVHVIDRAWDDEFLDGFFALETWGNDNVSFPGECYQRYIEELWRKDALLRGDFTLSGKPVQLSNISCPVLAITFEHDNIVPHESARVLLDRVSSSDKVHLHLPGGHVGAVVSKKAKQTLWPKLADFWLQRDAAAHAKDAADAKAKTRTRTKDATAKDAAGHTKAKTRASAKGERGRQRRTG